MVIKYVIGTLDLEGKNIKQTNVRYGNFFNKKHLVNMY